MAGNKGQFFTVSEALQAILELGDDGDGEEHVWDDDDDNVQDSPPANTLPFSPIPSTSLEAMQQVSGATPHLSTPYN